MNQRLNQLCYILLFGCVIALGISLWNNHNAPGKEELQRARIEGRDSIIKAERDSWVLKAAKSEQRDDSLQKVINAKNQQLSQIHIKYVYLEKNIISLSADSSLSFFLRAVKN